MRRKEQELDPIYWDPDEYMFEKDEDDVVFIESRDDYADNPTEQFFRLTCYGLTYDRLVESLEHATRLDMTNPFDYGRGDKGFTQIDVYDENGDSECIVVVEIRLPGNITSTSDTEYIERVLELIKRKEEEFKDSNN